MLMNPPMVSPSLASGAALDGDHLDLAPFLRRCPGILFTGPRRSVEILYLYLSINPAMAALIRAYRSGYLAENRRKSRLTA
jgi:hypothetical protein